MTEVVQRPIPYNMNKFFAPILFSVLVLSACTTSKDSLPSSSGMIGDIILIMDSTQWKGPLGKTVDSLFSVETEGLPRPEAVFHLKWVDPRKLNSVLKQRRNLIFAVTLDQKSSGAATVKRLFTKESLDQIRANPDLFSRNSTDVFSKGQEVLYLFSTTEKQLIEHIRKNGKRLIEHFDIRERERLSSTLFKSKQMKGVSQILKKELQCDIKIPFGYELVMSNEEFFWTRQMTATDDKDIFIARKKYTSQDQFKRDSLIKWRDAICEKYLFGDPDRSETHLMTETTIPFKPVITREISFNKKFAVEMRGLWKTYNLVMGGPFLSYTLADPANGMMYYIEGFTISPGRPQREIMRELETILYTFKISGELVEKEAVGR